jgi:multisubunit Na+/H+ antiporter MnhC subunit
MPTAIVIALATTIIGVTLGLTMLLKNRQKTENPSMPDEIEE